MLSPSFLFFLPHQVLPIPQFSHTQVFFYSVFSSGLFNLTFFLLVCFPPGSFPLCVSDFEYFPPKSFKSSLFPLSCYVFRSQSFPSYFFIWNYRSPALVCYFLELFTKVKKMILNYNTIFVSRSEKT